MKKISFIVLFLAVAVGAQESLNKPIDSEALARLRIRSYKEALASLQSELKTNLSPLSPTEQVNPSNPNQRFQLLQGKYIDDVLIVTKLPNGQTIQQIEKDTCTTVFRIDTQTGATWYLKSDVGSYSSNDTAYCFGDFGWAPVGLYSAKK